MRKCKKILLALAAAGAFFISSSGAFAQPVTGYSPIPSLENLPTGLLEMVHRLGLTHAQHEQVERIIANETMQLWLTRANPTLSVAKIFAREQDIRLHARRQIESILTPHQKEKLAKRMMHEMEERERWSEDPTEFFSIPAIY
jgi:Spy/CpxP family protein refolding chaperone